MKCGKAHVINWMLADCSGLYSHFSQDPPSAGFGARWRERLAAVSAKPSPDLQNQRLMCSFLKLCAKRTNATLKRFEHFLKFFFLSPLRSKKVELEMPHVCVVNMKMKNKWWPKNKLWCLRPSMATSSLCHCTCWCIKLLPLLVRRFHTTWNKKKKLLLFFYTV